MNLLFLLGCEPDEVREARCLGPVVELVKWRNGEVGRPVAEPAALAAEERRRVEAAEAGLRTAGSGCRASWEMGLWTEPDTPPARLRDETLRRVLAFPPVEYTIVAVGPAGVTTLGRPGVVPPD